MPAPFTYPVADSIYFRNEGTAFISENVRDAILEASQAAINNDRYPFLAQYNANAGIGRYLEYYASRPMNEGPFIFPENSEIVKIIVGATSNSTGTIGVFLSSDLINPVFSFSLNNEKIKIYYNLTYYFNALDEIMLRVTSGSIAKPFVTVWVNTQLI